MMASFLRKTAVYRGRDALVTTEGSLFTDPSQDFLTENGRRQMTALYGAEPVAADNDALLRRLTVCFGDCEFLAPYGLSPFRAFPSEALPALMLTGDTLPPFYVLQLTADVFSLPSPLLERLRSSSDDPDVIVRGWTAAVLPAVRRVLEGCAGGQPDGQGLRGKRKFTREVPFRSLFRLCCMQGLRPRPKEIPWT